MRKIRIIEHISLDGVIQHSADENDFPYGDWTAPYRTPAGRELILAAYGESFGLLPSHLRYVVGLLAKSAEQSDGGPPQCGNKIYRYPPSGRSCMGAGRDPWIGHRRGHSPHQGAGRPGRYPFG